MKDLIGRALRNSSFEDMVNIISLSYLDLPPHLKTCLLYLSIFPEGHIIEKENLIRRWIGEGFIQKKSGYTVYESGEMCFNDLINRNLIQAAKMDETFGDEVKSCRVHDTVHNFIVSKAVEENFVTIFNGREESMSSRRNVRRVSLQKNIKEEHQATPLRAGSILHLRSTAIFPPAIGLMPHLSSFVVLRVLNLSTCALGDHNLRGLWSLVHLRYLGLSTTGISDVPEEVGKLQFLQVLDLRQNLGIKELPSSVTQLRRLMCLLVDCCCKLPDGFGNLTSMEVLDRI